MQTFDLIILGGGPGGYPLAARMARKGWKVAIVDNDSEFGGTCLNWGCIPTKALLASSRALHLLKSAADFGIRMFSKPNVSAIPGLSTSRLSQLFSSSGKGLLLLRCISTRD